MKHCISYGPPEYDNMGPMPCLLVVFPVRGYRRWELRYFRMEKLFWEIAVNCEVFR